MTSSRTSTSRQQGFLASTHHHTCLTTNRATTKWQPSVLQHKSDYTDCFSPVITSNCTDPFGHPTGDNADLPRSIRHQTYSLLQQQRGNAESLQAMEIRISVLHRNSPKAVPLTRSTFATTLLHEDTIQPLDRPHIRKKESDYDLVRSTSSGH